MSGDVLIIDDDARLRDLLSEYLNGHGWTVIAVADGNDGLKRIADRAPDAVILDIMMPGPDGLAVLGELRKVSSVPVIMLTARGDETDRIVGLELGADDYLPKPFNPRELLARLKALLRRRDMERSQDRNRPLSANLIEMAGIQLAVHARELRYGGNIVSLSGAEARLLEALMRHPNETLTRDEIMNLTHGRDFMGFERTIDVTIGKLRQHLEHVGDRRDRIKTVWGRGYMWVSDA